MQSRPSTTERVRISDVARAAGVSVGTVSKALNNTGTLKESTRAHVRSVADRLGFVADPRGRSLSSGRTYTVGFLTTDSYGRFSMPILMGAEDALAVGRMSIILSDTREDQMREEHLLRALQERRVDGLIVTNRPHGLEGPLRTDIPTVYTFDTPAEPAEHAVVTDRRSSMGLAIDHLLELGRTRILHIAGPASSRTAGPKAQAVAEHAGSALVRGTMHGDWSEAWGRRAIDIALASGHDIDAVCCDSDQIARGALERLLAHGRSVPQDVAVTGFGNWTAMSEATVPAITSIEQNLREIGRLAGTMLLDLVEGRPVPTRQLTVRPHLVVRGSTI
ncbi:LacI family DNA-binding transcriptional regulator [Brachybacterium sp. YJGR34]|uniref:LacI family DNA-binding transcriptional regulator n=1 Tax=Brachybacterium sp. YJGR34 TaxID=2059911 RepID=UPI000E0A92BB|nr:LacI family DNA-binding transcriptional regulator [Brachybacterium sp. YJGR34]